MSSRPSSSVAMMKLSSSWPSGRMFDETDSTGYLAHQLDCRIERRQIGKHFRVAGWLRIFDCCSQLLFGLTGRFSRRAMTILVHRAGSRKLSEAAACGFASGTANPIRGCSGCGLRSKLLTGGTVVPRERLLPTLLQPDPGPIATSSVRVAVASRTSARRRETGAGQGCAHRFAN